MAKHHLIITGTGRTGTTFLMQLLTELGLDTGYADSQADIHAHCNAGMEKDLRSPNAPYVVKSPWMCEYLDTILEKGQVIIDHALVPVRDLQAAAQSRRHVTERFGAGAPAGQVPGGLWLTERPEQQELVLALELYKLIFALARHAVPLTLLHFPRLVTDAPYLYQQLVPVLAGRDYPAFHRAFKAVSRPELVHDYRRSS